MWEWLRSVLFDRDAFERNAAIGLGLFGAGVTTAAAFPEAHIGWQWLVGATLANGLAIRLGYQAVPGGKS